MLDSQYRELICNLEYTEKMSSNFIQILVAVSTGESLPRVYVTMVNGKRNCLKYPLQNTQTAILAQEGPTTK